MRPVSLAASQVSYRTRRPLALNVRTGAPAAIHEP
jgi:hypothetical protein